MSYILKIFLLFAMLFNSSLTQEYNCSSCYNEIKNSNLMDFCSKALSNECNEYNLEHSTAGLILCGYFIDTPC